MYSSCWGITSGSSYPCWMSMDTSTPTPEWVYGYISNVLPNYTSTPTQTWVYGYIPCIAKLYEYTHTNVSLWLHPMYCQTIRVHPNTRESMVTSHVLPNYTSTSPQTWVYGYISNVLPNYTSTSPQTWVYGYIPCTTKLFEYIPTNVSLWLHPMYCQAIRVHPHKHESMVTSHVLPNYTSTPTQMWVYGYIQCINKLYEYIPTNVSLWSHPMYYQTIRVHPHKRESMVTSHVLPSYTSTSTHTWVYDYDYITCTTSTKLYEYTHTNVHQIVRVHPHRVFILLLSVVSFSSE